MIRSLIRNNILDILSLNAKPNPGVHILNGHFLSRDNNTSNTIFKTLLKRLESYGIKFINFNEAVKKIVQNEGLSKKECLVAFSFDDGFEECFTKIKPVLDEYNIKAGFFINPGFVDGDSEYQENLKKNIVYTNKPPMNWEQIKQLKNEGHVIGSHTIDHNNLQSNDIDMLNQQIGESKVQLEKKLNYSCEYFAFPFGRIKDISQLSVDIAKKYYTYIFSQDDYKNYFSFNNSVINRRHFECDWPYKHVLYFLKRKK